MSFLDSLSDPLFKKSHTGETIFYPWSVLGKGYVIKPESRVKSIRDTIKWVNFGVLIVSMTSLQVLSWVYAAILIGVYYVFYVIWTGHVTKGMRVSGEPLKISESMGKTVAHYSLAYVVSMLVVSLIFVVLGVWMFFAEPQERLMAALGVLLFGAIAIWNVFMIRTKIRQKGRKG